MRKPRAPHDEHVLGTNPWNALARAAGATESQALAQSRHRSSKVLSCVARICSIKRRATKIASPVPCCCEIPSTSSRCGLQHRLRATCMGEWTQTISSQPRIEKVGGNSHTYLRRLLLSCGNRAIMPSIRDISRLPQTISPTKMQVTPLHVRFPVHVMLMRLPCPRNRISKAGKAWVALAKRF